MWSLVRSTDLRPSFQYPYGPKASPWCLINLILVDYSRPIVISLITYIFSITHYIISRTDFSEDMSIQYRTVTCMQSWRHAYHLNWVRHSWFAYSVSASTSITVLQSTDLILTCFSETECISLMLIIPAACCMLTGQPYPNHK